MTEPDQDGAAPSHTHVYQWRQTITFQECVHDDSRPALPSTQQLSVDSVFVLYNREERILRYALSNSIGPVRGKADGAQAGIPCVLLRMTLRSRLPESLLLGLGILVSYSQSVEGNGGQVSCESKVSTLGKQTCPHPFNQRPIHGGVWAIYS